MDTALIEGACPMCERPTVTTYNWVHGYDGKWYHECLECENVFLTDYKIGYTEQYYLDLIRAQTRRRIEAGEVIDLDALANQLRDLTWLARRRRPG